MWGQTWPEPAPCIRIICQHCAAKDPDDSQAYAEVPADKPAMFPECPRCKQRMEVSGSHGVDAAKHLGLVRKIAWRYVRRHVMDSPQYSDGCVGLVLAAKRFDATQGHRFTTYAWHCIRGHILMGHNRRKRTIPTVPLEFEPAAPPEIDPSRHTIPEAVAIALRQLHPRQLAILWDRFAANLTLDEIGLKLGISKERVRQISVKAMEKVRRHARETLGLGPDDEFPDLEDL